MEKIYKLQNGTDIRGVAYPNDEKEVTLTKVEVEKIARAFHVWLKEKTGKEKIVVAVGNDSRITGEEFRNTIIEALTSQGCDVVNCKLSTTPSMFMTTVMDGYKCDGSIMITASHLPFFYNGLKFFTENGGLEKADIKAMLDIVCEGKTVESAEKGSICERNLIDDYAEY